jgi:hypothetical protein
MSHYLLQNEWILLGPWLAKGGNIMGTVELIILIIVLLAVFGGGGGYYYSRRR